MFSRFFKPRWQHSDRDVRLAAIATLDEHHPRQREALKSLALQDPDAQVRTAALKQIRQRDTLAQWLTDAPTEQQPFLRQRLQQLLNDDIAATTDTNQRAVLLANLDTVALVALVQTASDKTLRDQALGYVRSEQDFLDIALNAKTADTRLAAAEKLPVNSLKTLQAQSRDKALQRFCREQLKQLQTAEKHYLDKRTRVQELLAALRQHQQRPFDNLYSPRLDQLIQAWQQHNDVATEAEIAETKEAVAACYAVIQQHQEQQEQERLRQQAATELRGSVDTLRESLAQLATLEEWPSLGSLQVVFDTQQRRWDAASEFQHADASLADAFNELAMQWRTLLTALADPDTNRPWPETLPRPPDQRVLKADTEVAADAADETGATATAAPAKAYDQAHSLLNKLQSALRHRQLRPANALMKRLQDMPVSLPVAQQRRLEKLQAEWQELQDWQRFAAVPKKEQLCEAMEQLIDSQDDPETLANKIQALQEEWRHLGAGHDDEQQALWERFRQASDQAYGPCREFYQELDALKADNLEKRRALCQQLESFLANQPWDTFSDWSRLQDIRLTALAEWKRYQPVKFMDNRPVGQLFDQLIKQIDQHLDSASAHHREQALTLITQAQALLEQGPSRDHTEQFKTLQKQWRDIGWIRPQHYRPLQKQFRSLADQYFALNKQVIDANREQQALEKQQLQDALAEAARLLQQPLADIDKDILRQQYQALQTWQPREAPLRETLDKVRRQLNARLQLLPQWQKWQQLQQRLHSLPEIPEADEQQQTLAISLEVSLGIDSPEQAREARTRWQLEQLVQARRVQNDNPIKVLQHHLEQLAALPGITADTRQRVEQALLSQEPKG